MTKSKELRSGSALTFAERKRRIEQARGGSFLDLALAAGFDRAVHFRHFDWSGADFRGLNLRGFDFTGARLHGCRFDGALIGPGRDANGVPAPAARFEMIEIGRVRHEDVTDVHAPAPMTEIANLAAATDYDAFVAGWRRPDQRAAKEFFSAGAIFQDAPFTPQMVVVPAGTYLQGDERLPVDGIKRRQVTIPRPFAIGRFTVTFEEWDAAQADPDWRFLSGIGPRSPTDQAWGRGRRPVINVSWAHAEAYCWWLNGRLRLPTGTYRLPSEAEWEYACRAGTTTAYSFGDTITRDVAQFSEHYVGEAKLTAKVGSFPANAFGLHEMHGNVWEWCEGSLLTMDAVTSVDGSPIPRASRLVTRVLRGGSWRSSDLSLRSFGSGWSSNSKGSRVSGFRLARTLRPAS
jgi:formylglycine-generating enzyme required for sulfatase activity